MIASRFAPISLADLNAKAEMLTRLDNKYIVSAATLARIAPDLARSFDVLDIDGKREFGYRTCYFDSPMMCNFKHHVQGRRLRSKVRIRQYLDAADLCFVEVKLKTIRKITVKKRLKYDPALLEHLTPRALHFVEDCHMVQYGRPSRGPYAPVMQMQYQRMTLVAHDGAERLTIDRHLRFWNDQTEAAAAPDMYVIETKSRFGRGIGDRILRGNGRHPVGSASKYCIGLAALDMVPRFNRFRPAFRRLMPDGPVQRPQAAPSVSLRLAS